VAVFACKRGFVTLTSERHFLSRIAHHESRLNFLPEPNYSLINSLLINYFLVTYSLMEYLYDESDGRSIGTG
jgi:hypothetical protein